MEPTFPTIPTTLDIIHGTERNNVTLTHQVDGQGVIINLVECPFDDINGGMRDGRCFFKGSLGNSEVLSQAVKCIRIYNNYQIREDIQSIQNEVDIRNYFIGQMNVTVQNAFDNHNVILIDYVASNERQAELRDDSKYHFVISRLASENGGDLCEFIMGDEQRHENDFKNIFRVMVRSVSYLHDNNIFHRDLKPENFALGNNNEVYIIDFGHSRVENTEFSLINSYGTHAYCPPELRALPPRFNWKKAEVFVLGLNLFRMLTGGHHWRFHSSQLRQVLRDNEHICGQISEDAIDLLQRMLMEHPGNRIEMNEILQHPWMADAAP